MPVAFIKTSREEEQLIKRYSIVHVISVQEVFKTALLQKIEDEFDVAEIKKDIEGFNHNPKTHSLEELRETYDL